MDKFCGRYPQATADYLTEKIKEGAEVDIEWISEAY